MSFYQAMKGAPRYLTMRYGSLNSYAWEVLFPKEVKNRILSRRNDRSKQEVINKMKMIVDEASMLAFIFAIKRTFNAGSEAAKNAVDILKDLGVQEFYLGDVVYSERNENVLMGDVLADKLLSTLSADTRRRIQDATSITDILNSYKVNTRQFYA